MRLNALLINAAVPPNVNACIHVHARAQCNFLPEKDLLCIFYLYCEGKTSSAAASAGSAEVKVWS